MLQILHCSCVKRKILGSGWPWAKNRFVCSTMWLNENQPADMLESLRPRIRRNWPHSTVTPHQSKRYTPLPPRTHSHTLRKSLHPRLHQSSPVADELPSSPRLITSLLSLAANQAQRRERKRDSGGEQEVCLWMQWCLSPSLSSSFSIFPYLPLSTGGGGGRPNSPWGGLWTLQSLSTYQSFTLTGERKKKRNDLINHPGSHSFHVPPSYGDREWRKKWEKKKKNERKTKNNLSRTSVSSLMSVPSDKQHEAEINRNKWLLLSAVCTRVQLFLWTDFLYSF